VSVVGARRGFPGGCENPAVLDLAKPAGARDYFYGERGIAVTANQVVEPVQKVDQASAEWRAMESRVASLARETEISVIARTQHRWLDEVLGEAKLTLSNQPLVVGVSRPPGPAEAAGVYFFEGSRKISTPEHGPVGFGIAGWMLRSTTGAWTTAGVIGSTISEEGYFWLSPLARVRAAGRDFWIMFVSGAESGGYAIYELTADRVVRLIQTGMSGC